jgi:hypothetical protein
LNNPAAISIEKRWKVSRQTFLGAAVLLDFSASIGIEW